MSNSFNISAALAIASLDTKLNILDTVCDNIRNIDVPNIQTVINANKVVIDDFHDVHLPTIETELHANYLVIEDLHVVDIPNMRLVVNSTSDDVEFIRLSMLVLSKNAIDAIKAVVDDIRAIDVPALAIPQNVRGDFSFASLFTSSDTFLEVLNVTGSGILQAISARCTDNAYQITIQITIDGTIFYADGPITGDTLHHNLQASPQLANPYHDVAVVDHLPNILCEFSTSLLIEVKEATGAGNVECAAIYSLDDF